MQVFFCISLAISWLDESYLELSSTFTSTLLQLLEGIKDVDAEKQDVILKVLERSIRYKPNDVNTSTFFHLVVKKFGETMTEDNLKKLLTINYSNQTNLQSSIQDAIQKHLLSFSK